MDVAEELFDTLKSLCTLLRDAHVEFCLIGGLAVAIQAKPRATEDIDLLVLIEEQQIQLLIELLKKRFSIIHETNIMHFENATICRTVLASQPDDAPGVVVVDFLLADREIYQEALRNPISLTVDGVTIPLARPESLIKMKELSHRPQDLLDIAALKEALNEQ
jgi:hypothetical protein